MPASFQWTEEKKRQMIAAYEQGEGVIAIAKRFHLRHESVTVMPQEQGITIRKLTQFARTHTYNHSYNNRRGKTPVFQAGDESAVPCLGQGEGRCWQGMLICGILHT